jgi:hypothetical protein
MCPNGWCCGIANPVELIWTPGRRELPPLLGSGHSAAVSVKQLREPLVGPIHPKRRLRFYRLRSIYLASIGL